jgi:hypothetical protein
MIGKVYRMFVGNANTMWSLFAIQTLQAHICAWRGQIGSKAIFRQICNRYSGNVNGNAGVLLV